MFNEAINAQTKRVLEKISQSEITSNFYLAGGTALAIQFGHRESIDLDWFSKNSFSNSQIKDVLSKLGKFELNSEDEGTIHGTLDDVKVSFLNYPYENIFPLISFQNIKLADERDIASMKIDAMSSRGSKKDFIDLYFLLKKYFISELFDFFENKYKNIHYNKLHILKSFAYFEVAEDEPMPKMIQEIKWEEVKAEISRKVKEYLAVIHHLKI